MVANERDGIADVVLVAVGTEQQVELLEFLLRIGAGGVFVDPWIDDDDSSSVFDLEGGVSQPGDMRVCHKFLAIAKSV
jgi:hypothetical protein